MVLDEPGYVEATVGGLIGLLFSGVLVCGAGYVYFSYQLRGDPYGLPGLGAIIVAVPAALLGQALGCWTALRLSEIRGAAATAGIVAAVAALMLWIVVRAIARNADIEGLVFSFGLLVLILPTVARWVVIQLLVEHR